MHCSGGLASGGCVFQGAVVVTDRRLFCHDLVLHYMA